MTTPRTNTLPVQVLGTAAEAEQALAHEIAARVRADREAGRPTVLGLATGRTPGIALRRTAARRQNWFGATPARSTKSRCPGTGNG